MSAAVSLRLVRDHFSSHAQDYDRFARVQKIVAARLAAGVLPIMAPGLALDVGTGTGELGRCLRAARPELPLVVCDIAPGMTRYAAAHLTGALAADADAQALPFRDASFDTVVSASVYQWMNDLDEAFRSAARVLRPQGVFGFALYGSGTLEELRASYRQALCESGSRQSSHFQNFPSEPFCLTALAGTGMEVLRLWSETETEWHPGVRELLQALKKIGAQNANDQRPRGLASRRIMQRMIDAYRTRYGTEKGIPATYQVIYGIAQKRGEVREPAG